MTRKKVQAEEIKAADIPAEVQAAEQDIEKVEETNVVPEGAPVAEGKIPAETEQKTEAPQTEEDGWQPFALEKRRLIHEFTEEDGWQPFALEKRRLIHEFTEEDNNVLNEKIADLAEKEIEMDEKVKSYQAILKGTITEKKEALKLRAEGYEEREFECPVLVNYKLGKKIVKHPETGEILSTTFLTAEERQRPLFPEEDMDKKEPGEDTAAEALAKAEEVQDGAEDLLDEAHAEDEQPAAEAEVELEPETEYPEEE